MNKRTSTINTFTKFFASLLLYLVITASILSVMQYVDPSVAFSQRTLVEDITTTLGQINQKSQLPTFDTVGHAQSSYEDGASNITSAILFLVDFFKYIIGTLAVLILIISGVRFIIAVKKIDEIAESQKESIKYALIGLIIVMLAEPMIKLVFFGEQGEVFRSEADIQQAAERGTQIMEGVYRFMLYFAGALAVLMLVVAGFRRVTSGGNEETITKTNKAIMWAIIGLIVLGLAELVVKDIIFPDQGTRLPDINRANQQIISLTNFASGFVATLAVAMFMYGGYLYVMGATNEENTNKAKKVIIAATIGLILAMGAFALVNTFIKVEPLPRQEEMVTTNPADVTF
jgi:hypothetical protein